MKNYLVIIFIFFIPLYLFSENIFDKNNSEPLTTKISTNNLEWKATVNSAQKSFPSFLKLYTKYKNTKGVSFLIKVPLNHGNKTSHFWFTFKGKKNKNYIGTYFELPKELMMYQNIEVSNKEIEDWMIDDHGYLYGGYSLRLQRKRLSKNEQISFDKYIGIKVYRNNELLPN